MVWEDGGGNAPSYPLPSMFDSLEVKAVYRSMVLLFEDTHKRAGNHSFSVPRTSFHDWTRGSLRYEPPGIRHRPIRRGGRIP